MYRVDSAMLRMTLDILWQTSESMFVFATFFGATHYFLSWVKKRRRSRIIYITACIAFAAWCFPLSYLFVNVELYRYTHPHPSLPSRRATHLNRMNRWNSTLSTLSVIKPVVNDSLF